MTEQRPSLAEDDATEMTPYSKTDLAWRLENEVHFPQPRLGEDLFHYIARHIGQPKISSLEFISQPEVINSQTMKDGRLQVVDVHGILEDVVGIVVGLADGQTALDTAPSHPHRETAGVMVATVVRSGEFTLTVHGSAKLSGPHDQCVIQHTSLLEIEDQSSRGLIDPLALQRNVSRQVVVLIPAAMVELNEAHATLGKPPR